MTKTTDWQKIITLLGIISILIGWNATIWLSSLVPENISTKTIAQSLLSMLSLIIVFGIILIVRKKLI